MGSASGTRLRGLRRTTRSTLYRAAFGKIVNALVEAVLMPLIAAAVGSPNFDSFAVLTVNGNDVKFGVLLTAIVNFLLIAAAVYFAIVMPMNKMIEARNRRLGIDPAEEEVAADVAVLTEIRDLLAERRGGPTSGTTAL